MSFEGFPRTSRIQSQDVFHSHGCPVVAGGRREASVPFCADPRLFDVLTTRPLASFRMGENLLFVTTTWKTHSVISAVRAGCTYCGREHTAGSGCQIAKLGLGGGVGSHLGGWLSPEICEQKNVQKYMHVFTWRKKPPPNAHTHKCV